MRNYWIVLLVLLLMTACVDNQETRQEATDDNKGDTLLYNELRHYWDDFPYDDAQALTDTAMMQRGLSNWLDMLAQLPESEAQDYVRIAITAGSGKTEGQKTLFLWLEELLNNPNSPYRNEEFFIPVLEAMTEDTLLSDLDKTRPRLLLAKALKNRKGTKAADVAFFTRDGVQKRLYDIHCGQILIYFFNPDCHDCKRVSERLKSDIRLNNLQKEGRLQVIALYPDEEQTSWNKLDDSYPSGWIIGRAPTAKERERYNLPDVKEAYILPAIPSIYILDSTYTVLVKDGVIN